MNISISVFVCLFFMQFHTLNIYLMCGYIETFVGTLTGWFVRAKHYVGQFLYTVTEGTYLRLLR